MMRRGGSRRGRGGSRGGSRDFGGGGGGKWNNPKKLLLVYEDTETVLSNRSIRIGRRPGLELTVSDETVSGQHVTITNGTLVDAGSTNGTLINGKKVVNGRRYRLRDRDELTLGNVVMHLRVGVPKGQSENVNFTQSKRFPKRSTRFPSLQERKKPDEPEDNEEDQQDSDSDDEKLTVEELMNKEFDRIVGHGAIKKQLRQFYKKVRLDRIREQNGKAKRNRQPLYHMMFLGPPGTGKTTMANLVARIMRKMKLVKTDKVVFVNNALELLAGFSGQTPAKVDAKVEEARGGVLFIDEAYSIVKEQHQKDSFGKEAIETIMKHLDPPTCVFIFAGYEKPMADFLKVNEGLARRIKYNYIFEAYSARELVSIFMVLCEDRGEILEEDMRDPDRLCKLIERIPRSQREQQNGGVVRNWIEFAQIERDDRIDIDEAVRNPIIASILKGEDLLAGLTKLTATTQSTHGTSGRVNTEANKDSEEKAPERRGSGDRGKSSPGLINGGSAPRHSHQAMTLEDAPHDGEGR